MNPVAEFLNLDAPHSIKPIVKLPSGDVQIRDTAIALGDLIAPTRKLFVRANTVVELVEDANGPRLDQIREHQALTRFERHCVLVAWRTGKDGNPVMKPTKMPIQDAKAILVSLEFLERLPRIELVSNSPIITEGGKVLGPGYHDALGGVLVTASRMPDRVSHSEAISALLGLTCDFRFASDGDLSRALASFITPALKMGGLISGPIPMDVAEADKSQSGKTYRQKLVRAIYNEQAYPISRRDGGVGSLDESLSAALLSGKPFITYDNLRGRLDSQILEMTLTWGKPIAVRVPHRGEVSVDPSRVCFQLTSNGVETTRDLANRSSIVRLVKQPAGFQFQPYQEGDLLKHVEANQAYYLGCVFALIRSWLHEGKPTVFESRHDFSEWASVLAWFVQQFLITAPLMDGHREAQERVSDPSLTWLRRVAVAVTSDPMEQCRELRASDIYDICSSEGIEIPGTRNDDRAIQTIGMIMGKLFRDALDGRVEVENYTVKRVTRNDPTNDYRQNHFYHFSSSEHAT